MNQQPNTLQPDPAAARLSARLDAIAAMPLAPTLAEQEARALLMNAQELPADLRPAAAASIGAWMDQRAVRCPMARRMLADLAQPLPSPTDVHIHESCEVFHTPRQQWSAPAQAIVDALAALDPNSRKWLPGMQAAASLIAACPAGDERAALAAFVLAQFDAQLPPAVPTEEKLLVTVLQAVATDGSAPLRLDNRAAGIVRQISRKLDMRFHETSWPRLMAEALDLLGTLAADPLRDRLGALIVTTFDDHLAYAQMYGRAGFEAYPLFEEVRRQIDSMRAVLPSSFSQSHSPEQQPAAAPAAAPISEAASISAQLARSLSTIEGLPTHLRRALHFRQPARKLAGLPADADRDAAAVRLVRLYDACLAQGMAPDAETGAAVDLLRPLYILAETAPAPVPEAADPAAVRALIDELASYRHIPDFVRSRTQDAAARRDTRARAASASAIAAAQVVDALRGQDAAHDLADDLRRAVQKAWPRAAERPRRLIDAMAGIVDLGRYEKPARPDLAAAADVDALRIDPEVCRILYALGLQAQSLVYFVARGLTTSLHNGAGWVLLADLETELTRLGISVSSRTWRHTWLKTGEDAGLWAIAGDRLYIAGYADRLPVLLVDLLQELPADRRSGLIENGGILNAPGVFASVPYAEMRSATGRFRMQIWNAAVYKAWLSCRRDGSLISRYIMCRLWGLAAMIDDNGRPVATGKPTLIAWEKSLGIQPGAHFTYYADDTRAPEHAITTLHRLADNSIISRKQGQLPNSYHVASPVPARRNRTTRRARARVRMAVIDRGLSGAAALSLTDKGAARLYFRDGAKITAVRKIGVHLRRFGDDGTNHYETIGTTRRGTMLHAQTDGVYSVRDLLTGGHNSLPGRAAARLHREEEQQLLARQEQLTVG